MTKHLKYITILQYGIILQWVILKYVQAMYSI